MAEEKMSGNTYPNNIVGINMLKPKISAEILLSSIPLDLDSLRSCNNLCFCSLFRNIFQYNPLIGVIMNPQKTPLIIADKYDKSNPKENEKSKKAIEKRIALSKSKDNGVGIFPSNLTNNKIKSRVIKEPGTKISTLFLKDVRGTKGFNITSSSLNKFI